MFLQMKLVILVIIFEFVAQLSSLYKLNLSSSFMSNSTKLAFGIQTSTTRIRNGYRNVLTLNLAYFSARIQIKKNFVFVASDVTPHS